MSTNEACAPVAPAHAGADGLAQPFFAAADHLGSHSYFHAEGDAVAWRGAFGGYVLETTPRRIWRCTQP